MVAIKKLLLILIGLSWLPWLYFMTLGHGHLDPIITTGRFPFVVEYKQNGEIIRIEDVIRVEYRRRRDAKFPIISYRDWRTTLESTDRSPNLVIVEQRGKPSVITPERTNNWTHLRVRITGAYLMGDPRNIFTGQGKPAMILHETYEWHRSPGTIEGIYTIGVRSESHVLDEAQLMRYFGIELLEFEFAPRIRNRFSLWRRFVGF